MTRVSTLLWAALVVAAAPGLLAQEPARPREPRGFDFSPDGVWRKRARAVRTARQNALRSRNASMLLNAPMSMRVTGVLRVPIFLVAYKNTSQASLYSQAAYDQILLQPSAPGRPYTLRSFYEEISNGALSVQGQVIGWITLDSNDTWYEGACNGDITCNGGNGHVGQLIREAIQKSDGAVDYGQFDNDGPDGIPNSPDDDGIIDLVTLVHPEMGAECSGFVSSASSNIWSHRFFYRAYTGSPLSTADPRRDGSGAPVAGSAVRVDDYTIQSGLGGAQGCDPSGIMPPGTVAHETGHGLGLPDLYDINPNDSDDSEGIGHWGLMGSGNYSSPFSPAHMEGFSRLFLGWVTVRDITTSGSYELGPYAAGDTIFRVTPTGPNPRNEYYLLENRQAVLSDAALVNSKAGGLLVFHVDQQQYDAGAPINRANTGPIHGLSLEEADGIGNLRSSTAGVVNRGDAGDPWPGASGRRRMGYNGAPSFRLNSGGFAGFILDSITQVTPGGPVRLRIHFGAATIIRGNHAGSQIFVRTQGYSQFEDLFFNGDTMTVRADSIHFDASSRTRFRFTSWSNGQPRTHLYTASTGGGTLTASFARDLRMNWAIGGNGTITASGGNVTGVYLPEGDSILLTAVPAAGALFTGWIGDTSTTNTQLLLRGTRPWAVTASFTAIPTLAPAAVVNQLLHGGAFLTPAAIQYLDQFGNNNGSLDLGDVAAWLDRTGQPLDASLMSRLRRTH